MTTAEPGVDEVLSQHGVGISEGVLMQDENAMTLRVNLGGLSQLLGGTPLEMPTQIGLIGENFNRDSPITDRIDSLLYLWGSALELDREKGVHTLPVILGQALARRLASVATVCRGEPSARQWDLQRACWCRAGSEMLRL